MSDDDKKPTGRDAERISTETAGIAHSIRSEIDGEVNGIFADRMKKLDEESDKHGSRINTGLKFVAPGILLTVLDKYLDSVPEAAVDSVPEAVFGLLVPVVGLIAAVVGVTLLAKGMFGSNQVDKEKGLLEELKPDILRAVNSDGFTGKIESEIKETLRESSSESSPSR